MRFSDSYWELTFTTRNVRPYLSRAEAQAAHRAFRDLLKAKGLRSSYRTEAQANAALASISPEELATLAAPVEVCETIGVSL